MLRLEVRASADSERRVIEGTVLPYGVAQRIGFDVYRFAEGSLEAARGTTPLVLGHDQNRPVGVLAELESGPDAVTARFRVDATADGDTALAQAASGSRSGLSLGAEPVNWTIGADGIIDVTLAHLYEVSLVSVPAFEAAMVTRVAAHYNPEGDPMDVATPTPVAGDPTPAPVPPPPPAELPVERAPVLVVAERAPRRLTLAEYLGAYVRAERGDHEAAALLQAALTVENVAGNPGVLPPSYTSEVLGSMSVVSPLAEAFKSAPMPESGMEIIKPRWTNRPDGGYMVDDMAAVPTSSANLGKKSVPIRQWAWAAEPTYALVERSTPAYVDVAFEQALVDHAMDLDAWIASFLPVTGVQDVASIGAGIAQVATRQAGTPGYAGRTADRILASPDQFGFMWDAEGFSKWTDGHINNAGSGSIGGLDVYMSSSLAEGDLFVAYSRALEVRQSAPARLTATMIGAMHVQIGVTSFDSVDLEIPEGIVRVTPLAAAAAGGATRIAPRK
jgi:HK97 family phage prohead protease